MTSDFIGIRVSLTPLPQRMPHSCRVLIQKSGESRIQPGTLNNLSKFALTLLIVVLVVITLLNVRERKYEIGVLTEIGADKVKVAAQFGRDMQGVVGRFAPYFAPYSACHEFGRLSMGLLHIHERYAQLASVSHRFRLVCEHRFVTLII